MPHTTLLPILGTSGIKDDGAAVQLKNLIWEKKNDTIFFSGRVVGFLIEDSPNVYYTGQVLIGIDAPAFTWFNGDNEALGTVTSDFPAQVGRVFSGSGSNKIFLSVYNTDPTEDLVDLSFSGSYTITNS